MFCFCGFPSVVPQAFWFGNLPLCDLCTASVTPEEAHLIFGKKIRYGKHNRETPHFKRGSRERFIRLVQVQEKKKDKEDSFHFQNVSLYELNQEQNWKSLLFLFSCSQTDFVQFLKDFFPVCVSQLVLEYTDRRIKVEVENFQNCIRVESEKEKLEISEACDNSDWPDFYIWTWSQRIENTTDWIVAKFPRKQKFLVTKMERDFSKISRLLRKTNADLAVIHAMTSVLETLVF